MFVSWSLNFLKLRTWDIFIYTLVLALCFVLAESGGGSNEELTRKSEDVSEENPQVDNVYSKRGWKTELPMWGKRAWTNLHPGWGKRDILDSAEEDNYIPQYLDKRAWQRLQGGWGKRFIPSEDDMVIRQLVAALEENDNENNIDYFPEQELDSSHQVNKRNWKSFSDGWGKRSNRWEKFRGSWGKRQPAWNNLKGLWGKRSGTE